MRVPDPHAGHICDQILHSHRLPVIFCKVIGANLPYLVITSVRCRRERLAFDVLLVASRGA